MGLALDNVTVLFRRFWTFLDHQIIGRGLKRCDKLTAEIYVTVPANSNREPGFEEKLVAYADDTLITEARPSNATDDDKVLVDARYHDLSFAADIPLRRIEEALLLGHFCSLIPELERQSG